MYSDESDDVVAEFFVPRHRHVCVTGGADLPVLKRISADHRTRIHVPDGVADTSAIVTLEGFYLDVYE